MFSTKRENSFKDGWIGEIPEKEEAKDSEEVTITQKELNEIFKKLNIDGNKGITVDKKTFDKIEAYIEHNDSISSYKRRIAKKELEKYIVSSNKVIDFSGYDDNYLTAEARVNSKKHSIIKVYSHLNGSSDAYSLVSFRDFKFIIAGTEYSYLSEAFSENGEDSEEDKFIDLYLWVLDKGGSSKIYKNLLDERILKITLPGTKKRFFRK